MFANDCLGELDYEATAAAIAMAGIFLTFLIEYLGNRTIVLKQGQHGNHGNHQPETESNEDVARNKDGNESGAPEQPPHQPSLANLGHHHHHVEDALSVMVMEAGIIFHSISTLLPYLLPSLLRK